MVSTTQQILALQTTIKHQLQQLQLKPSISNWDFREKENNAQNRYLRHHEIYILFYSWC